MSRLSYGPPADDAEFDALADLQTAAFLGTPSEETRANRRSRTSRDDLRLVRRGGEVVAGLTIYQLGQWFGGRRVPMAGIASVAVAAEHRGSGAGSQLMTATLQDLHEAGSPISTLYPATQPLYRAAGWELSGAYVRHRLATADIDARDRTRAMRRTEPADRERLIAVYDERARRTSGVLSRNDSMWRRVLGEGDPSVNVYVVHDDGKPTGYVSYVNRYEPEGGRIACLDLVALDRESVVRLLTFFAHHRSQVAEVVWRGAPVDPVSYGVRDATAEVTDREEWMLRIVDVKGALESRGYPEGVECSLHLDVRDDVLGWNDGRFTLEVSGGRGQVKRGGRGRIRIDVRGLATMYTGHLAPAELSATGYLDAGPKELDLATSVFAGASPWMADFF